MSYYPSACKFCRGRGCLECRKKENHASSSRATTSKISRDDRDKEITRLHRDDKSKDTARFHRDEKTSATTSRHQDKEPETPSDSIYKTNNDREMASRQIHRNTMSAEERKKQDAWVAETLKKNSATSCPVGFIWVPEGNRGYRCLGGSHFTTHELISEGRNGYYTGRHRVELAPGMYSEVLPVKGPFYGRDPSFPEMTDVEWTDMRIEAYGVPEPTADMCKWKLGSDGIVLIGNDLLAKPPGGSEDRYFRGQCYSSSYTQGYMPGYSSRLSPGYSSSGGYLGRSPGYYSGGFGGGYYP